LFCYVVYVLAFSIIMLNTDLHSPNIKPEKKMKKEEYVYSCLFLFMFVLYSCWFFFLNLNLFCYVVYVLAFFIFLSFIHSFISFLSVSIFRFIKSNRGINAGQSFSQEFLEKIYDSILKNEIKLDTDATHSSASHSGKNRKRKKKRNMFMFVCFICMFVSCL